MSWSDRQEAERKAKELLKDIKKAEAAQTQKATKDFKAKYGHKKFKSF